MHSSLHRDAMLSGTLRVGRDSQKLSRLVWKGHGDRCASGQNEDEFDVPSDC